MIATLTALIGLLVGFYARSMYDMLRKLTNYFKDRLETPAGVVRPTGQMLPPPQQAPRSETGGIRAPNPEQYVIQNMKARDEQLKRDY